MGEPSATRPWVDAFAREMESKLAENRHKGDRAGWWQMSRLWLLGKLKEEVAELETALVSGGPDDVRSECADVGNFAMMLADVGGGMQPDPSHERIAAVIRAAVDATAKRRGIDAVKAVTRQGGGGVPEYTHARGVMEHAVAALTPEDLARFGIGGKE